MTAKLTKVQKEIVAVLEAGGWIGASTFGRYTRALYAPQGTRTKRKVRDESLAALSRARVTLPMRVGACVPRGPDAKRGGSFPDGHENRDRVARIIWVHSDHLAALCGKLYGVEPTTPAGHKIVEESGAAAE